LHTECVGTSALAPATFLGGHYIATADAIAALMPKPFGKFRDRTSRGRILGT
jgi:hypothetical protein